MSAAAQKLAAAAPTGARIKRGPDNQCAPVYEADLEDAEAIQEFRKRPGESWATAQTRWDEILGVSNRIPNDKFRYHWRRRCFCWPDDQRLS